MELRVDNICKSFGAKQVLKNINFSTSGGQALGYLGRNGAGKTTTIRILTDIFRADSGKVLLDNKPIDYSKVRLGYLAEERGLYAKVKVGEQMIYFGELRGMTRKEAKKSAMDLLEELEASEYWSKKLETLSKGNQQKIQLAIAVINNPDIIILDEPFSGLDPVNASILKKLVIKEVSKGKIVLFSSHQMPYVEEFCEHICIINKGEIVLDGKIKDIKKSYARNRIAVFPEREPDTFLKKLSELSGANQIILDTAVNGECLEIKLRSPQDKASLFKMLSLLPIGMDSVQVMEPTLEDIFVEKVGDEQ